MQGHTGKVLAESLLGFLTRHEVNIADCRGQSYDNASNMSGKYNGMQAVIHRKCPLAEYVSCAAHSLNLVGQSAVRCCLESVEFFGFVQGLYSFLVASTHRWKVVHNRLKKKGLPTVKRLSDTRWSAHSAAVKAVVKGYGEIKAGLKEIAADPEQKGDTREEALNHASNMDRVETGILTLLKKRKEAYATVASRFGFLRTMKELPDDKLTLKAPVLSEIPSSPAPSEDSSAPSSPVTTTPSDDEDMSFNDNDELHEHDQTMEFENNGAMKLESPEVRMYKLILENKLETVFPNIEVALRIYLSLIISNCSGERPFSILRYIKNSYRSTAGQRRLNDLILLSIEQDILCRDTHIKTPSWFDKLKAPRPSDLARKRKINPPPVGKKRSQTTSTGKRNYDPKKVSPSERVREFPGEHLTVSSGKRFCKACRESLVLKKSVLVSHVKSTKHECSKQKLLQNQSSERDIADALAKHDGQTHRKGETLDEESKVYRVKVLMAFMKAGIPLEKLECQELRDLLQENGYRLTDARHMRDLVPFIHQQEQDNLKTELKGRDL
ncbi:zinc finger MYM-type 1-like [Paramuricea clavata]|uniref:Zinc finger MYM-type 1-like n=1 Tax=Paramuricea clavata TaxID=317549 RepID=A0A7D9JTA0_PARCT|nr:zinc finger MYM-type 1-like [Paramuricea clavata]